MAHKRFRECDGVKYVTNLLRYNTGLIKTISDAPKRRRVKPKTVKQANKVKDLDRQIKVLDKVLKSHKGKSSALSKLENITWFSPDRRI